MSTRRILPRLAIAIACLAALALSACTSDSSDDKYFQYGSATPVGTVIPVAKRKPVFDVDGSTVTSSVKTSLAARKGTVTVVPYWASWCSPCRIEMPLLQNVQRTYGAKADFLGINFKDDRSSAKSFLSAFKITFPSIYDETGRNVQKLGNSPAGPPFTMIVDKAGRVAAFYVGRYAEKDLERAIDTLRAET